ncbi:MAG TPA: hypothetical protein V6C76_13505 [Drouetiella sp.]
MTNTEVITFDRAISLSTDLIYAFERGESTIENASEHLDKIVSTANGARGFFVALLTGESNLANNLPPEFIDVLKSHPDVVCDLLVKNLVMSATMAVTHERNGDKKSADGSRSVNSKTKSIICRMDCSEMTRQIHSMKDAIQNKVQTGTDDHPSEYAPFLARWRYDAEQLKEALTALSEFDTQ